VWNKLAHRRRSATSSTNKIYTDIVATRSSVVLRFVLIGKPLAVIHLGSNVR